MMQVDADLTPLVRGPGPRGSSLDSAKSAIVSGPAAPPSGTASPTPAGVRVNSRPPVKPANGAVEPFKHVIDEYKHQAQTITCTCGWHGSSATLDRGGSEWTAHLFEVRGKKR